MFRLLWLPFWILLHSYIGWRLAALPPLSEKRRRWMVGGALAFLFLLYPVSRMLEDLADGPVLALIVHGAAYWVGVVLLTCVCLFAVDLVTLFGLVLSRWTVRLRYGALLGAAILSIVAVVQGARPPVVTEHVVKLERLPPAADGLKLVLASDFHLGAQIDGEWLDELAGQIAELEPDVVVLAGDLVEGHGHPAGMESDMARALSRVRPRLGLWAVLGNHDRYGAFDGTSFFDEAGCRLLRNDWEMLMPGLALAGAEDEGSFRPVVDGSAHLSQALRNRPADVATVFVSHRPLEPALLAAVGVDLALAGHTHGGQLWPFDLLAWALNPLLEGRYDNSGMTSIVTRGAGTWGPRMRLWAPGEIVLVTLRAGDRATN